MFGKKMKVGDCIRVYDKNTQALMCTLTIRGVEILNTQELTDVDHVEKSMGGWVKINIDSKGGPKLVALDTVNNEKAPVTDGNHLTITAEACHLIDVQDASTGESLFNFSVKYIATTGRGKIPEDDGVKTEFIINIFLIFKDGVRQCFFDFKGEKPAL